MASSPTDAAVALTRLGLGARPGEMARVAADPRGWALAQIRPQGASQPSGDFVDTPRRLDEYFDYQSGRALVRRARRQTPQVETPAPMPAADAAARCASSTNTPTMASKS